MTEYEPGDKIKVTAKDGVFEGVLLPEPQLLKTDSLVLKLEQGYNIGIKHKKIEKVELLEQHKPNAPRKKEVIQNTDLPKVSLLSTGGTISSKVDYTTGGVTANYTAEDFIEMCPELSQFATFKASKIMSVLSEEMNFKDWQKIAELAAKELNTDAKGIIITQGTDTLHYTTAALSFMLKNLNKPVIFTASQRSIDRGSTDAFMNLICATAAASKSDIAEVTTCLHGTTNDDYCILNRGTKVRKMHTSRRDAFRPVNELPLAKIFPDGNIEILNNNYKKTTDIKEGVLADIKFEKKVALIKVHPGMDKDIVNYYIDKDYKGIVIEGTGFGNVPVANDDTSLLPSILRAKEQNIPIVMTTQTIYGNTNPYVYTTMRRLAIEADCIFAKDMLPETALVKLGWVLGHTQNKEEVKEQILTNIAGEINENIDPSSFLF
jgi:glutamyl-tRNA(Gln) amidotransferase subunit D